MKRELVTILIGAMLVGASDAEAQRGRVGGNDRERGPVERLEPVRAPGRVVAPRVERVRRPARRPNAARTRVVYSSRNRLPNYQRRVAFIRADWGRAIRFRVVRGRRFRGFVNAGELRDLLGHRTVRMIRDAGFDAGLRGGLRGEWILQPGFGDILVVTMGGADVAEILDYDRDGFVDEVWLIGRRGFRPIAAPR